MVKVNVFVMPRHLDQFSGLTGSVVEYVTKAILKIYRFLSSGSRVIQLNYFDFP
jgi:hypothetical protein